MSKLYRCTVNNCGKVCHSKEYYENHIKGHLTPGGPTYKKEPKPRTTPLSKYYRCTVASCGKAFEDEATYQTHTCDLSRD